MQLILKQHRVERHQTPCYLTSVSPKHTASCWREAQWHKQAISHGTLILSAMQYTAVYNVESGLQTQGITSEMLNFGQFHICMQCIVNIFSPSLSQFCVSCSIKRSLFTVKKIYQRLTVPMQIIRVIKNTDGRASHSWVQETLLPPKQLGSQVCWMDGLGFPKQCQRLFPAQLTTAADSTTVPPQLA